MKKYLVTIEFRYLDAPKHDFDSDLNNFKITIGIYDTFKEACKNGNDMLEILESKFKLNEYANGEKAKKERFSINGGCFGTKNTLITNLGYLKTPFEFYAKIETLKYIDINDCLKDINEARERYIKHRKENY